MKTFLKTFFKKLWEILVHIFYCFVPYLHYLEMLRKQYQEDEQQETGNNETEKKSESRDAE